MINFIISEDHDVINMLLTSPCHLKGPDIANTDSNILLVNIARDYYQSLFSIENNEKLVAFYNDTFFLKNTRHGLKNINKLLDDIERIPLAQNTTLYVLSEENLFLPDNKGYLSQAFLRLNGWLTQSNLTIYFCTFGTHKNNQLISSLNAHCNQIGSVSVITSSLDSHYLYTILYSHTVHGIVTNTSYHFDPEVATYTLVDDKEHILTRNDTIHTDNSCEVLTLTTLLKDNETAPERFNFYDSLEQLLQVASTKKHATIVLPCLTDDDIEIISRQAYQLRIHCGNELKLVVREVVQCICYSDERFLLDSGINLIVPVELSFSHFLSQTAAIQNQVYVHQLPVRYEELLCLRPSYDFSGLTGIEQFTHHVKSLVSRHINLAMDFAFIRLDLLPTISARDCISLCKLRRDGDLLTPCEDAIYIFLSAVRANDIDVALNKIFSIKVNELFANHTVYVNPIDIIEVLDRAQTTAIPFTKELRSITRQISSTNEPPTKKIQTRAYARCVPLERNSQKVLP